MALANVACLLAQETKGKVLMVDWDLEAPGLHEYFAGHLPKEAGKRNGLIEFFMHAEKVLPTMPLDEEDMGALEDVFNFFLAEVIQLEDITQRNNLFLVKAGRLDKTYSDRISAFDWQAFFKKVPSFFTHFAAWLNRHYAFVLIDSRTGHTDIGGICTMLMPEKLVLVFTPNSQSLGGVLELAEKATKYRRNSDDFRPMVIYPLPSRVELDEDTLKKAWQTDYTTRFSKAFQKIYDLPANAGLDNYFQQVQIRHASRYAYGENIAALAETSSDINSLSFAYKAFVQKLLYSNSIWELQNGKKGVKVFLAYAHRDEALVQRLQVFLAPLKRSGNVALWSDRQILPGAEWENEIKKEFRSADVILLMISADFLASEYIWEKEMSLAMEQHGLGKTTVVPVFLRPVDWQNAPFAKLQGLPRDARPVSTWKDQDEAWAAVAKGLNQIIQNKLYPQII